MKCSLILLGFLFSKTGISGPTADYDRWRKEMDVMLATINTKQQDIQSRRKAWHIRYQTAKKQMDELMDEQTELNAANAIVNQMVRDYNQKIKNPPQQRAVQEDSKPHILSRIAPNVIKMSDKELQPYLEDFKKLSEREQQNREICRSEEAKSKTSIDVLRGYSDLNVVQQTKDKGHWECELSEVPSGRLFHTDINCHFPDKIGQCVEWADGRYFQLTGFHGFKASAANWTYMAHLSKDWLVYDRPVYPSIAVFKPNSNGAGGSGHVSIVESITSEGKLCTSHWNAPFQKKLSTYIHSHQEGVVYLRHVGANATYLL